MIGLIATQRLCCHRWTVLILGPLFVLGVCGANANQAAESGNAPVTGPEVSAATIAFFDEHVHPILRLHCYKCHGTQEIRGGLQLTSRVAMLKGGDAGPVLDEESLADSPLLRAIRYEDLEMPPSGKLPQPQIDILTKWIEMGAPWNPAAETPMIEQGDEKPSVREVAKSYWAYQPLREVAIPVVNDTTWPRNAIDRFVLADLQRHALQPAPQADRRILIRRLYYDLVGLPPSPEEIRKFVEDPATDAYEQLVDRLLASPQYGEKWGRHWLDLVHYAETNGYERDGPKANVWRYRDYVIRAFNDDKPYDRFIMEQLAGDELPDATPESITATAYFRLGLWDDEPADPVQAFYDSMDEVVSTTCSVFLGMSMGCARCHDHKIDPIPQRDYYRFLAFFGNTYKNIREDVYVKSAFELNTQRALVTSTELAEYEAKRNQYRADLEDIDQQIQHLEDLVYVTFSNPEKEDAKDERVRRQMINKRAPTVLSVEQHAALGQLRKKRSELRRAELPDFPSTLAIQENGREPADTFILIRGSAHAKGDKVEPGFPELFDTADPQISPLPEGIESTGRRSALARWLTSPSHPLVARVMVNRLWQHHFGRGLVATSNDFGQFGDRPTHPELLDWLAQSFMKQGWSLKEMHRRMVTSATYQMAYRESAESAAVDPENYRLWRSNMRRLTSEEVRDTILYLTGKLNEEMGGPSIYPVIPAAYLQSASRPDAAWGDSPPGQRERRSVYVHVKRSVIEPVLGTFDSADTDSSCPVRFATTVPTQALTTINGPFFNEQSIHFAQRLRDEVGNDRERQVIRAIELALCRNPEPGEVDRALQLMTDWEAKDQVPDDKCLEYFCLLVLNLNELIYLE